MEVVKGIVVILGFTYIVGFLIHEVISMIRNK